VSWVDVKREDAKQPHTFGLRLELIAEVRHAIGRGLCSSQYGKGAEAESIEWWASRRIIFLEAFNSGSIFL
jgi:hypothetical protein